MTKKLHLVYALMTMLLISWGGSSLHAEQLSPEAALQRAKSASQNSGIKKSPMDLGRYKLIHTSKNIKNAAEAYFYVFNNDRNNGFMIVSADDRVIPVLGYSDNGSLDMEKLPPNMKYWLEEYGRQIQWMYDHPDRYKSPYNSPSRSSDPDIEPMITTKWGQSTPFNNLCPQSPNDPEIRCVTGCVATAMAQIMYYHRWPEVCTGYFDGRRYDWDNMLEEYKSEYSWENDELIITPKYNDTQAFAVATLMRDCGISVNMDYSPSSSGASSSEVPKALKYYFGYDPNSINIINRDYYSVRESEELIIKELSQNRPVYFSGRDGFSGHAFVLDGWSSDGKAHINWGWYGSQDGYFAITALNPDDSGIGGNDGGYNNEQRFIIGIQKPGESAEKSYPEFVCGGDFTFDGSNFTTSNGSFNGFQNASGDIYTFHYCLKLVDPNSGAEYIPEPLFNNETTLQPNYYTYTIYNYFDYSSIPDGAYDVYPIYRINESDKWRIIRVPYGMRQYIKGTVTNGEASFSNGDEKTRITISDWVYDSIINPKENNPISFKIANNSEFEYTGIVYVALHTPGTNNYSSFATPSLYMQPNSEETINTSINGLVLNDGEYELCVLDKNQTLISELNPITIDNSYKKPEETIKVESVTIDKTSVTLEVGNTLLLNATVLPENATNKNIIWNSSEPSIATIDDTGKITALAPGETVITAQPEDGSEITDNACVVTVTEKSVLIESITFEHDQYQMAVGEKIQPIPIITPEDATNKVLEWESSNPALAEVDSDGIVTALRSGAVTILAKPTDGSPYVGGSYDVIISRHALEVTDWECPATINPDSLSGTPISFTIKSNSSATYDDSIRLVLYNYYDPIGTLCDIDIVLEPGESKTVDAEVQFADSISDGEYYLGVWDNNDNIVSQLKQVFLVTIPEAQPDLAISNFIAASIANPILGYDIQFTITNNSDKDFNSELWLSFYKKEEDMHYIFGVIDTPISSKKSEDFDLTYKIKEDSPTIQELLEGNYEFCIIDSLERVYGKKHPVVIDYSYGMEYHLEVSDWEYETIMDNSMSSGYTVRFTITNTGNIEYNGELALMTYMDLNGNNRMVPVTSDKWGTADILLEPQESQTVTMDYSCPGLIAEGDYFIGLLDNDGNIIGDYQPVTFVDNSKEESVFEPTTDDECKLIGIPEDVTAYYSIPATAEIDGVTYSVTAIDDNAFDGCTTLTSLLIGNHIRSIGKNAFKGCTSLTSIVFGDPTDEPTRRSRAETDPMIIMSGAFADCYDITSVISSYTTPPVIESEDAFTSHVYRNATRIVPDESLEEYNDSYGWMNFNSITSGINSLTDSETKVTVSGDKILISGAESSVITVYNISGSLIYQGTDNVITGLNPGLYILKIGANTYKTVIR